MSYELNTRIKTKNDTTENWNNALNFVPLKGEIIIYNDYQSYVEDDVTKYIPGIKIGDGMAYVQDLPFVDKYTRDELMSHINNLNIHITAEERTFWNRKINVNDYGEVIEETLVLNRN